MKKGLIVLLALCMVFALASCGKDSGSTSQGSDASTAVSTSSSSSAASSSAAQSSAAQSSAAQSSALQASDISTVDGDKTVFNCGGTQIALPTKSLPGLSINITPKSSAYEDPSICLISVYETASLEQSKKDFGEDSGMGFLFNIEKLTAEELEQYQVRDLPGCTIFATDGTNYYVYSVPTDVQFYRSGNTDVDTDSEDWKAWEAMCEIGPSVQADMIERNGLSAYSE